MKRRWLSILAALVLCLGLLPGTAGAEEGSEARYRLDRGEKWTESSLFDALWAGYTAQSSVEIELLRDITLTDANWSYATDLASSSSPRSYSIDGKGHTVTRKNSQQVFSVGKNAELTLRDIIVDGGAVWSGEDPATRTNTGVSCGNNYHLSIIKDGATMILDRGAVLQNNDFPWSGAYGAAVYVWDGTLIMRDGAAIRNNAAASSGAGVYVYSGSKFQMEGGEISGNYAGNNGGGVCTGDGTFEMTGGSVTGNAALAGGGGISVFTGTGKLTGGLVSENTITRSMGGGVLVHNGALTVGGELVVRDNLAAGGAASNVYLNNGNKITVEGLGQGAQIGATVPAASAPQEGSPTQITSNTADQQYFSSDDTRYVVSSAESGVVQLSLRVPSTVTFHAGEGIDVPEPQETNEYGKLAEIPEVTRDGYTFDGWFTTAEGGTKITADTVFDEDTTIHAHWLVNRTITFVSDGEAIGTQTVADGRTAEKPADPTRSGYIFGGWYKEAGCENPWSFETDTVTADLTLYAKWTPKPVDPPPATKTHTVRFLDGGTELASLTVREGSKAAPPDEPVKQGYRFAGWYTDPEGTEAFDFETPVTGDLTLYAKWTALPGGEDVPSGGGSSGRDDDDDDDEPRPPAATATTVTQNPDGSTTKTTTDRRTGTVTTVTTAPDGSSVTVVTDRNGHVVSTEASVPKGTAVLPAAPEGEVKITVKGGGRAEVTLPAENAGPGTVAVLVSPEGTKTVVRKSILTENGVVLTVQGSAVVRLEDRGRTFPDVPEGWKAEAAAFVSAREILNGGTDGLFRPDAPMTRAMLAVALHNLEGNPSHGTAAAFLDVPEHAWYAEAVSWASARGIVTGYTDEIFGPGDRVTREQLAVMLWRAAGRPAPSSRVLPFPDADQVADYAREALCWAVEHGIIHGGSSGTLDPKGLATRAQTAQMLKNFLENG